MADFCKQCSERLFGKDFQELAGLLTPEQVAAGLVASVLCEGCGPIQVDNDGRCLSVDCDHQHGKQT